MWKLFQGRLVSTLSISIIASTLITGIILYLSFSCRDPSTPGDARVCTSFEIGFYASWLQDFLFFLIIGIATLAYSLRDPDSFEYEQRIRALANSAAARNSTNLQKFLENNLENLGAFCEKGNVELTVTEIDEATGSYKVSATHRYLISNLYKDRPFNSTLLRPTISADELRNSRNKKKIIGQVTEVTIFDMQKESRGLEARSFTVRPDQPIDLDGEISDYRERLSYPIEKDSSIRFSLSYWVQNLFDTPHIINIFRFTEDLNVYFSNSSNADLSVSLDASEPILVTKDTFKKELLKGAAAVPLQKILVKVELPD